MAVRMGLLSAGCIALMAAGCGGHHMASRLARAEVTHEYSSAAPPAESATGGAATAAGAVRAFAAAYINWSADTVSADMRSLAARSVGQARSAMTLAAARTAQDYELRRAGIANSGSVQAVAPAGGPPGSFVVVTRELTTASGTDAYRGLRPQWHVALATAVQLTPGRWVVSRWQPES